MTGVVAALFLLFATEARAWVIKDLEVEIRTRPDSSFQVKERIKVDFGQEDRHGLFREIPIRYLSGRLKFAFRFHLDAAFADHSRTYSLSTRGRRTSVRIGDADKTVSGVHTYTIVYTIQRGMLFFDDHDEIYWNAVGLEWFVPIEHASLELFLPPGLSADKVRNQAYTGESGDRGDAYRFARGTDRLFWQTSRTLTPGEGLTIVAGFPKGIFTAPHGWRVVWWWFSDNIAFFLGVGLPFATFFTMLTLWRRRGVDPDSDLPIMTEYLPPEDLSPAEVGTLWDESADDDDVMSMMLDLAARGFIKFSPVGAGDMTFERLFKPGDLRGHEVIFLDALFGNSNPALLSEARLRFSSRLSGMKDGLYNRLVSIGFFPADPRIVRSNYLTLGIALAVAAVFLAFNALEVGTPPFHAVAGGGILSGIIVAAFARAMPRKTEAGAKAMRRILGFREFVVRAEKERIDWMFRKDPTVFERLLPYALVLGVGKEWVRRFDGLLQAPPAYYSGGVGGFTAMGWYDTMNDHTSAMRTPPAPAYSGDSSWSSSSSDSDSSWGSSGFSDSSSSSSSGDSGGSSGGGGGGGGGGAW